MPVYDIRGNVPYCYDGDSLVKSNTRNITMLASESFGHGFLEIKILENKRSGVVKNGEELRFLSKSGRFEFVARVTAIEDVEDVFCVLRFEQFGEARYVCRKLGSLSAGKSKVVSILTQLEYEMPEQIHFYSGNQEIRTSLVPARYEYSYGNFELASK